MVLFPVAILGAFLISPLFLILLFCCFCWCILAICLVEWEDRRVYASVPSEDTGPPVDPLPEDQRPHTHKAE